MTEAGTDWPTKLGTEDDRTLQTGRTAYKMIKTKTPTEWQPPPPTLRRSDSGVSYDGSCFTRQMIMHAPSEDGSRRA